MKNFLTVVIGGGASGLCAAITLARLGDRVIVCEKTTKLGKKILASGNGRCNLMNDALSETYYNTNAHALVKSVFDRFGRTEILGFFKNLGLEVYSQNGRAFPVTNQAASVLRILEMELHRLSVPVEFNFNCSAIVPFGIDLSVKSTQGKSIECRRVILTGGGKSYPAYGSDGSAYAIAARLGHTIIEPVPSAVPLVINERLCHALQGQRIFATAKSIIGGQPSEVITGELLFTKYGLSGTCIIDVSEPISIALNRRHEQDVALEIDLVPFMELTRLKDELANRKKKKWSPADMLSGILPEKLSVALKYLFETRQVEQAAEQLKKWRFSVTETRGWNEAEFTAGGVEVSEVTWGTLESKLVPGVHFAGEVLDVSGPRGGYNLAWAWASGCVAAMPW